MTQPSTTVAIHRHRHGQVRIVEAIGALDGIDLEPLRRIAERNRAEVAEAFTALMSEHPQLGGLTPIILYRTLGPALPGDAAAAALLWGAAQDWAQAYRPSVEAAGYHGHGTALGDNLFDAIISSPNGVTFTVDEYDAAWTRVRTPGGMIHLANERMLDAIRDLATSPPPGSDPEYPLVLSAGERRSFTANTIFRGPGWRKRHPRDLPLMPVDHGTTARRASSPPPATRSPKPRQRSIAQASSGVRSPTTTAARSWRSSTPTGSRWNSPRNHRTPPTAYRSQTMSAALTPYRINLNTSTSTSG